MPAEKAPRLLQGMDQTQPPSTIHNLLRNPAETRKKLHCRISDTITMTLVFETCSGNLYCMGITLTLVSQQRCLAGWMPRRRAVPLESVDWDDQHSITIIESTERIELTPEQGLHVEVQSLALHRAQLYSVSLSLTYDGTVASIVVEPGIRALQLLFSPRTPRAKEAVLLLEQTLAQEEPDEPYPLEGPIELPVQDIALREDRSHVDPALRIALAKNAKPSMAIVFTPAP